MNTQTTTLQTSRRPGRGSLGPQSHTVDTCRSLTEPLKKQRTLKNWDPRQGIIQELVLTPLTFYVFFMNYLLITYHMSSIVLSVVLSFQKPCLFGHQSIIVSYDCSGQL